MNTPRADPPLYPGSKSDSADDRAPRWVKIFGIIAIVLVLLFVILHLTGHSPGGHGHSPPAKVKEHGAQPP